MFSHDCRVTPVLGYQPADLLGKSAFDFYHPEDKAHMKDTFDQGIAFEYQNVISNIWWISFYIKKNRKLSTKAIVPEFHDKGLVWKECQIYILFKYFRWFFFH